MEQFRGNETESSHELGAKDKFLQLLGCVQALRSYANEENNPSDVPDFGLSDESTEQLRTPRGRTILEAWTSSFARTVQLCEEFAELCDVQPYSEREILRIETRSHTMTVRKPEVTAGSYIEVDEGDAEKMLAAITKILDALAWRLELAAEKTSE